MCRAAAAASSKQLLAALVPVAPRRSSCFRAPACSQQGAYGTLNAIGPSVPGGVCLAALTLGVAQRRLGKGSACGVRELHHRWTKPRGWATALRDGPVDDGVATLSDSRKAIETLTSAVRAKKLTIKEATLDPWLRDTSRNLADALKKLPASPGGVALSVLVDILSAYAVIRVLHEPLLKVILAAEGWAWKEGSAQTIVKAVVAFSALEVKDRRIAAKWRAAIDLDMLRKANPSEVAKLVYHGSDQQIVRSDLKEHIEKLAAAARPSDMGYLAIALSSWPESSSSSSSSSPSSSSMQRPAWAEAVLTGKSRMEWQKHSSGQIVRALALAGDTKAVQELWKQVPNKVALHKHAYAAFLQELGPPQEVEILQHLAQHSTKVVGSMVLNVALMRCLESQNPRQALKILKEMDEEWMRTFLTDVLEEKLCEGWPDILKPTSMADAEQKSLAKRHLVDSGTRAHKYVQAARYAMAEAPQGDAKAVMASLEAFSLRRPPSWLKFGAAFEKGEVIDRELCEFRDKRKKDRPISILEVGTFLGYSAMRMLCTLGNQAEIVSLESDPEVACLAMNLLEHAGVRDRVDVWIGKIEDSGRKLAARFQEPVDVVYMDHNQAQYHDDLLRLEELGVVGQGTRLIFTQVLKPGAPLLVHRLWNDQQRYELKLISAPDCGLPRMEDWVAVADLRKRGYKAVSQPPWALRILAAECNLMRYRTTLGLVDEHRWNGFVQNLRRDLGILMKVGSTESAWPSPGDMDEARRCSIQALDFLVEKKALQSAAQTHQGILAAKTASKVLELALENEDLDGVGLSTAVAALRQVECEDIASMAQSDQAKILAQRVIDAAELRAVDGRGLVDMMLSVADLELHHYPHWEHLAQVSAQSFEARTDQTPMQLANMAFAIVRMKEGPGAAESGGAGGAGPEHSTEQERYLRWIFSAAASQIQAGTDFTLMDLQRLLYSMARSMFKDQMLCDGIVERLIALERETKFKDINPVAVGQLTWSMARLRIQDKGILKQLADQTKRLAFEMVPAELANVSWAFARLGWSNTRALRAISIRVRDVVEWLTSQEIANICWAFSTLRFRDGCRTVMTMIAEVERRLESCDPMHLANVMESAASLGVEEGPIVRKVMTHLCTETQIGRLTWNGLLSVARAQQAYALQSDQVRTLRKAFQDKLRVPRGSLTDEELADASWECAQLARLRLETSAHKDEKLISREQLGRLASQLKQRAPTLTLSPRSARLLALAAGSLLNRLDAGLLVALAERLLQDPAVQQTTETWLQVVWMLAMAEGAAKPRQMLEDIREKLPTVVDRLTNEEELATLAWIIGKLNMNDEVSKGIIIDIAGRPDLVAKLGLKQMVLLLWASTRVDATPADFFDAALRKLVPAVPRLQASELRTLLESCLAIGDRVSSVEVAQKITDCLPQLLVARRLGLQAVLGFAPCLTKLGGAVWPAPFVKGLLSTGMVANAESPEMLASAVNMAMAMGCVSEVFYADVADRAQALLQSGQAEVHNTSRLVHALSRLSFNHSGLEADVAVKVKACSQDLPLSSVIDLLWPCAVFGTPSSKAMLPLLVDRLLVALEEVQAEGSSRKLRRDALEILQSVWPLGQLSGQMTPDALALVKRRLRELGRAMDNAKAQTEWEQDEAEEEEDMEEAQESRSSEARSPGQGLELVRELSDRFAFYKPVGWAIDTREKDLSMGFPVSALAEGLGLRDAGCPVLSDKLVRCGLAKTVRQAGSGIMLGTKTYEALFDMRAQLDAGEVESEELALLCGSLPLGTHKVDVRINEVGHLKVPKSDDVIQGMPAETFIKAVAHMQYGDDEYTLGLISTNTQRRGQIRIHTEWMGHPIADPGSLPGLERVFLHETHVSFKDADGKLQDIYTALPEELTLALDSLEPKDRASAEAVKDFLEELMKCR